jgi:hypothetical protein
MCPGDLARQHHVAVGDVCLRIAGAVFEFDLESPAKLFEINLRPIDPSMPPTAFASSVLIFCDLAMTTFLSTSMTSCAPKKPTWSNPDLSGFIHVGILFDEPVAGATCSSFSLPTISSSDTSGADPVARSPEVL